MDPVAALDLCGGVARWTELARLGVSRRRLLTLVCDGAVERPARGVFCRPDLTVSAVVRAVSAHGQLTCAAGARAHGLDTLVEDDSCHVRTIERPAARRIAGVIVHPWGRASGRLAPLPAVLHDCAICLPAPEAVAVLDSALRKGLVEPDDLLAVADHGPRSSRVRSVLELVDPQAQSVLESVARVQLRLDGVRDIASQVFVRPVGWLDLVVGGWLVLELDGWEHHREKFQEDHRRDAELTRLGFVVLRFTYADLVRRRGWFSAVVAETLDRGRPPFGHRG